MTEHLTLGEIMLTGIVYILCCCGKYTVQHFTKMHSFVWYLLLCCGSFLQQLVIELKNIFPTIASHC